MNPTQLNPYGQIGLVFRVVLSWVRYFSNWESRIRLKNTRNPAQPCPAPLIICALTKKHEAWVGLVKEMLILKQ